MCENYKYMLQIKPEYDLKYQKTGIHSQMIYLCEVKQVASGKFKLNYDKKRFNLLVKECGKCKTCRFKRASIKACQSQCEVKTSGKASFITLTFGNDAIKKALDSKRYKNMSDYKKKKYLEYLQWTIEKREFQLFMKRLRHYCYQEDLSAFSLQKGYKNNLFTKSGRPRKKVIKSVEYDYSDFKPRKIRFLHSAEYGEERLRPHHHAIIFGLDFSFDKTVLRFSWKKQQNVLVHFNNVLSELWPFGEATTDHVNYQACNYVARYVTKKIVNVDKNFDIAGSIYKGRMPEYCTQSNRPGLGFQYYIDNMAKINSDLHLYFKNQNGDIKECPLPRYFKELMRRFDKISYLRMKKKSIEQQEQFSNYLPEILVNIQSKHNRQAYKQYIEFKGNMEEVSLSKAQRDYLLYEQKKKVFPEFKNNYKLMHYLNYKDSDFIEEELWRVERYKDFEKFRRQLIKQSKINYIHNKVNMPGAKNLMLCLYDSIKRIKNMDNHYCISYLNS